MNMTLQEMSERPPWLVRLYHRGGPVGDPGNVAGAGFYVGDGRVFTCAHVVAAILGVQESAPLSLVAGARVLLDFPQLPEVSSIEVTVLDDGWCPVGADGSGDVATLGMARVPTGAVPAPLRRPATLDGHRFTVKGFPRGRHGVNATGVFRGRRGPQGRWVQLEDVKTEGAAVTGGFSGSPVWDYELSAVVGMIVSEYADTQAKIGSMIPVEMLQEAWPGLSAWVRWRLDLDPQAATHWLPRARGVLLGEPQGWYFTGRRQLLSDLSGWLRGRPGADRAIRVVTGPPGSGKSAVLAWLVVLADPVLGPQVPITEEERECAPTPGAVGAAVFARDKTVDQVVAELAAAAEVEADSEERLLAALGQRRQPFAVVVDALDEARPSHGRKIARLLADLATDPAGCGVRIVAGVRTHSPANTGEDLTALLGRRTVLLPVDSRRFLGSTDLVDYAYRRLVEASPTDCIYRGDHALAARVAAAVGRRASPLFLVAQLTCQALMLDPDPVDTSQQGWEQRLPSDIDRAFDRYLERFGHMEPMVRDLFTALAYAEGAGLPAGQLWADLATSLALPRSPYQAGDVHELLRSAASYVVTDLTVSGEPRYRLFHQELVDYFRRGRDEPADQRTIVKVLRARVPVRPDSSPDWLAGDSYTRTFAAAHAAKAEQIDELLTDPRFLLAAEPSRLIGVLAAAGSPPAVRAAGVYRRSVGLLRGRRPSEAAAYLGLHAHQAGAVELAERLDHLDIHRPWSVRWAYWLAPHTYLAVGKHGSVAAVAVGEVGRRPLGASGGGDGSVRVWDLTTCEQVGGPIGAHEGGVTAVALGEVGGRPFGVSGGGDGSVRVWDATTGEPVGGPVSGHDGGVTAVAITQLDGAPVAASCSRDESRRGSVRVWDLQEATVQVLEVGLPVFALAVGLIDDQPVLACGTWPGLVQVWNLHSGAAQPLEVGLPVFALAVGLIGHQTVLVCGSWDGSVRVLDVTSGQAVGAPLRGHTGGAAAVAVGNVNAQPVAISGGEDGTVRFWNPGTAQPVGPSVRGHTGRITGVSLGQFDGQLAVASSNDDGSVRVWDLRGNPTQTIETGSPVFTTALGELAGRPVVVTGGWDNTVSTWDLRKGAPVGGALHGHSNFVAAVKVGKMGGRTVVASGGGDGTVRLWDLSAGGPIGGPLLGHTGEVAAIAMAEIDGRLIAVSGGGDAAVRFWDLGAGIPIGGPLLGHTDQVGSVALGEIDRRPVAVSGGWDETVRLWDLSIGGPIGEPFQGHSGGVAAVAVAEIDGKTVILSGGGDETLRVWSADGEAILTIEVGSAVWGVAYLPPGRVAIATSLGLVFLEFIGDPQAGGAPRNAN